MKDRELKKNAILMVPNKKSEIKWYKNGELVTLEIKRNRTIDKIMHKIFKSPKCINIELDKIGSFVWEKCDGINNIKNISKQISDRFGKDAEPVMERLIVYIKILINNNLIELI